MGPISDGLIELKTPVPIRIDGDGSGGIYTNPFVINPHLNVLNRGLQLDSSFYDGNILVGDTAVNRDGIGDGYRIGLGAANT
ncbi:MAG: hypothetical protein KCHDKBKB_00808 [Elusimicrobia bacterium]|nr:hypothetical protein [Elusimicrobiota bacterium]